METPRCLLLRTSVHHGSTGRVAGAIAGVLGADVAAPEAVPSTNLASCDLLGIGSGVFAGRMHEALFAWLRGCVSHEEPTVCDMDRPGRARGASPALAGTCVCRVGVEYVVRQVMPRCDSGSPTDARIRREDPRAL